MDATEAASFRQATAEAAGPRPGPGQGNDGLVWTDGLEALTARAAFYCDEAGAVHLRGPAGTGKSTLARAVAGRLGRGILWLSADGGAEVAAACPGATLLSPAWLERALTVACTRGETLVLDGLAGAPAAALGLIAAAIADRTLPLGAGMRGEAALAVHPAFRAILVSTPDEAGRSEAGRSEAGRCETGTPISEALLDRLATIDLDGLDRDTELAIAAARSGLAEADAARIVDMVRDFRRSREYAQRPSLHCSVMLARLVARRGCAVSADDPAFAALALDLLGARLRPGPDGLPDPRHRQMLARLIAHFCGDRARPQVAA